MVQNEINNMSFLTADNKSKMAKVGALLWEVTLAGREGTPKGFLTCPLLIQPAALSWSYSLQPSQLCPLPSCISFLLSPLFQVPLPSPLIPLRTTLYRVPYRKALQGDACPVGRKLGLGQLEIRPGVL